MDESVGDDFEGSGVGGVEGDVGWVYLSDWGC